ncbi:type IV secretory system conjugative DNA transfer family protein [Cupriavidus respiraculi]|uniref:type IV secretory system conjugative DNA transfer family protein n=1 Tax=Cupriavidus respiraculi TaxID=195930 RepID=UPI001C947243|nr:type IV secretory system conjugative DNA transfer family protein [Cupriavidus respiraculi]MBY4945086.1 type IV secretory system conjugative DNA transfer family protein [Cupriavidus respiraculi]
MTVEQRGSQNVARIIGVIGASGSGKSRWLKDGLRRMKPGRLLVWDPQDEYGEFGQVVTDTRELVEVLGGLGAADGFAIVYQPGDDMSTYKWKFDLFCEIAYQIERVCVVAEEVADVTSASYAPPYWSRLSRKGRHRAMTLFAVTQRPAVIDKTFLGNCTLIHCCRLNDKNDISVMAATLGVPVDDVRNLRADDAAGLFQYIERDMKTGAVAFGELDSRGNNKPPAVRNVRTLPAPEAAT